MTFLQLQQQVAGMLSRSTTDFTFNSFDNLKQVINNALLRAQRLVDFKYNLSRGYLPLTSGSANYRTGMKASLGGSAVSVKKLVSVFSDDAYVSKMPIRLESDSERLASGGGEYALMLGSTIYLKNSTETRAGLYTTYYTLLTALSGDSDTNFLTEIAPDWIAMQASFELLHFIKEDERIQMSAGILRDKWDSLVAWNENVEADQDTTLD